MRRLAERLGGAQLYVPRLSISARRTRDEQIRAQFDGRNARQLAREFHTSERTVRRVLARGHLEAP
jgi:Mor family transcriptional regulator